MCSRKVGSLIPGQSGLASAVTIGGIVLIPFGIANIDQIWNYKILAFALFTALLSSVIPYSLELAALRLISPGMVGILLSLEPVIASLAGLILLGQDLTVSTVVAIVLIMIASVGTTRSST
ncbi:MAG: EamA family transporter [Corynebacterium sp.]|nr:EamA family transporter [Corynebacterium sp.]